MPNSDSIRIERIIFKHIIWRSRGHEVPTTTTKMRSPFFFDQNKDLSVPIWRKEDGNGIKWNGLCDLTKSKLTYGRISAIDFLEIGKF